MARNEQPARMNWDRLRHARIRCLVDWIDLYRASTTDVRLPALVHSFSIEIEKIDNVIVCTILSNHGPHLLIRIIGLSTCVLAQAN